MSNGWIEENKFDTWQSVNSYGVEVVRADALREQVEKLAEQFEIEAVELRNMGEPELADAVLKCGVLVERTLLGDTQGEGKG